MPSFDITEKCPRINIFKLNKAYYFKHFFDDPELFRELEPYYGELLKNSVESYPLRDKIVLVMKDMVWVEQAIEMGATMRSK